MEPVASNLLLPEQIRRYGQEVSDTMNDPRRELIAMVYRLHGSLRSLFAGPHSSTGLVLLEAMVLASVATADHPPTVSQVARELGYLRQSVQRAMNKLTILGLIERRPNSQHKASPVFVLTEQGHDRMHDVRRPSQMLANRLAPHFPADRAEFLLAEMRALNAAISSIDKLADDD